MEINIDIILALIGIGASALVVGAGMWVYFLIKNDRYDGSDDDGKASDYIPHYEYIKTPKEPKNDFTDDDLPF